MQHRRDRRDDDRGDRADEAERALVVVAAAEEPLELEEVRDRGDRRADHRRDRGDEHVAVADVRELVRDDAANLLARHEREEALGDGDGRVLRVAAGRERVRLLGRHQEEARDRDPGARRESSSTSATSSGASPGSSGRARLILSAIRSENQYIARLKRDRDQEERDDPARAADEPADRDEERREPGEQDPGAHASVHVVFVSFPADVR